MSESQESRVRQHLQAVLASPAFKASDRIRAFLAFIVEESLAGRGQRIKGYNVAIEALGREPGFDPIADPIVRIEAGRLRRALEHYYLTEGSGQPVRIDVPKGGYRPEFRFDRKQPQRRAENDLTDGGEEPAYLTLPTLAVLPFKTLGEDSTQAVFADGLTAEITVALTRTTDLLVASNYSVQAFRDRPADVGEIGRTLQVRFVLEGIVRAANNSIRVSTVLSDTRSGKQIWARTLERSPTLENLFQIQDDLAREVIIRLTDIYEGQINRTLSEELDQERPEALSAYQAALYLHHYNVHYTSKAHRVTREALEEAVAAEPHYAMGWAALGEIHIDAYTLNLAPASDRLETCAQALECTRKALWLDPDCRYASFVAGMAHLVARDLSGLQNDCKLLLDAEKATPSLRALGGWLLALSGDWEHGLSVIDLHMGDYGGHPGWLHHARFLDGYRQGDFEAALAAANRFTMPYLMWDPLDRAAALGRLGHQDAAQRALQELLALCPDFERDPKRYLECFIFQDELVQTVLEGLHLAGLPSH